MLVSFLLGLFVKRVVKKFILKQKFVSTSLQMERPSAMPHQEFTALTKEQKRNLPDERDGFITVEGHPPGQVEFKTP